MQMVDQKKLGNSLLVIGIQEAYKTGLIGYPDRLLKKLRERANNFIKDQQDIFEEKKARIKELEDWLQLNQYRPQFYNNNQRNQIVKELESLKNEAYNLKNEIDLHDHHSHDGLQSSNIHRQNRPFSPFRNNQIIPPNPLHTNQDENIYNTTFHHNNQPPNPLDHKYVPPNPLGNSNHQKPHIGFNTFRPVNPLTGGQVPPDPLENFHRSNRMKGGRLHHDSHYPHKNDTSSSSDTDNEYKQMRRSFGQDQFHRSHSSLGRKQSPQYYQHHPHHHHNKNSRLWNGVTPKVTELSPPQGQALYHKYMQKQISPVKHHLDDTQIKNALFYQEKQTTQKITPYQRSQQQQPVNPLQQQQNYPLFMQNDLNHPLPQSQNSQNYHQQIGFQQQNEYQSRDNFYNNKHAQNNGNVEKTPFHANFHLSPSSNRSSQERRVTNNLQLRQGGSKVQKLQSPYKQFSSDTKKNVANLKNVESKIKDQVGHDKHTRQGQNKFDNVVIIENKQNDQLDQQQKQYLIQQQQQQQLFFSQQQQQQSQQSQQQQPQQNQQTLISIPNPLSNAQNNNKNKSQQPFLTSNQNVMTSQEGPIQNNKLDLHAQMDSFIGSPVFKFFNSNNETQENQVVISDWENNKQSQVISSYDRFDSNQKVANNLVQSYDNNPRNQNSQQQFQNQQQQQFQNSNQYPQQTLSGNNNNYQSFQPPVNPLIQQQQNYSQSQQQKSNKGNVPNYQQQQQQDQDQFQNIQDSSSKKSDFGPLDPQVQEFYRGQNQRNVGYSGVENERLQSLQISEQRLSQLEEQFDSIQDNFFTRLNSIRDSVGNMDRAFEEQKMERELALDAQQRNLQIIEQKFLQIIETEKEARKESEIKQIRNLEEKTQSVKFELQAASKQRNDSIEQIHRSLEQDLPRISDAIKQEQIEREESDQNSMKQISTQLTKLNSIHQDERKNREESEQAIFDMLKDIISRVKNELDLERKTREETEEHLLQLLEDATSKLNTVAFF